MKNLNDIKKQAHIIMSKEEFKDFSKGILLNVGMAHLKYNGFYTFTLGKTKFFVS